MRRLALSCPALLAILAACASPQQQCINAATKNLRAVTKLVQETEGNVKRGYALEPTTVYRNVWVPCGFGYGDGYGIARGAGGMCLDEQAIITTRPKAIDMAQEKLKLEQLRAKEAELNQIATSAVAQCQAANPE